MARGRWGMHVLGLAIGTAVLAVVAQPSCTLIEPEVGDRLGACSDADSNPGVDIDFKTQIRPLFDDKVPGTRGCQPCHYPNEGTQAGIVDVGLALKPLRSARNGGRNSLGITIVPKSPCKSVIVQKLRGTFGGARMPKTGPYWEPDKIQLVMDWIAEGANGADDL